MRLLKRVDNNNKVIESRLFIKYKTVSIFYKILVYGLVLIFIFIGIVIFINRDNETVDNSTNLIELVELDYARKNRNFDLYLDPVDIDWSNKLSKYNINISDESMLKKICMDIAEEGIDLVSVKDNLMGKLLINNIKLLILDTPLLPLKEKHHKLMMRYI